jgi:hypothetical protein
VNSLAFFRETYKNKGPKWNCCPLKHRICLQALPATRIGAPKCKRFFSPASLMLCLGLLHPRCHWQDSRSYSQGARSCWPRTARAAVGLRGLKVSSADLRLRPPTRGCYLGWCGDECVPRSDYVAKLREDYDADTTVLDFGAADTPARINSWASAKTRHKLGDVLDTVDPFTSLLIVNSIYFKDVWHGPFERELTRDELFYPPRRPADKRSIHASGRFLFLL